MKILVPIKRVPDPYRPIPLMLEGSLDKTALSWVINPPDTVALEEALRVRERDKATEIVAVTVGPAGGEETLREALARSADRAILVQDEVPLDCGVIALLLAAVARREQPDLILMGRETSDNGAGEIGPRLAALLNLPQATFAAHLEWPSEGRVRVTRDTDRGRETLDVALPAVVTVDLRLNQPRLLSLYAVVAARDKPLERIPAQSLGGQPDARRTVVTLEPPPPRLPCRMVIDVKELTVALQKEAKVV